MALFFQSFQHGPFGPGDGVGLRGVGEREHLRRDKADILGGLAEAEVELTPHGAADMGDYPIQGHTPLFVVIKPQVNHLAEEAAALRPAESVGVVDVPSAGISRLSIGIFQERHHVPDRGQAQSDDRAPLCRVDQLVDFARQKARRHVDMAGVGAHFGVFLAHKGPISTVDGHRLAVGMIPHGEGGRRVVQVRGWVRPMPAMGQQKGLYRIIRLKLAENLPGQGTAGADGLGRLQPDQSGDIGQIGLPATPDDGVALAHQKSVSRFQGRHRVCNRRRAVEPSNDGFPAPVHYVEQEPAIAVAKLGGLEH